MWTTSIRGKRETTNRKKTIKKINKKNKENNNKNKEINKVINKEYNKNKEKNNKNKENNDQEIPLKKCRIIIVQFDGMDAYIKKAMPAKAKAAKKGKKKQTKETNMGRSDQVSWSCSKENSSKTS